MFVATVVPCSRLSTSASGTPAFSHRARARRRRAAGRIVRSGGNLVDGDPARLLVDEDQVGERAADIDADPLHAAVSSERRNDLLPDAVHLVEAPVQVGARDLVDPELRELPDFSRHGSRGPRSRSRRRGRRSGARVLRRGVEVAGVVVVGSRACDRRVIVLGHAVLRIPLHRVLDVVRAGGGRPAALRPGLLLVVGDPHGGEDRERRSRPGRVAAGLSAPART